MKCPGCGKECKEDMKFCSECGYPIGAYKERVHNNTLERNGITQGDSPIVHVKNDNKNQTGKVPLGTVESTEISEKFSKPLKIIALILSGFLVSIFTSRMDSLLYGFIVGIAMMPIIWFFIRVKIVASLGPNAYKTASPWLFGGPVTDAVLLFSIGYVLWPIMQLVSCFI
ncbi:zinc-ribbon domain-containing protein [Butyrivibrio sp. MB2005]|uniref:zinc-ribbon domain-containing protein n=1 Tax=Butyrivibrio sp. MB2005 TaxID=1280678 RepID=UPI00047ED008|nr:zinc ribbon domain-containing protein [Butyrivibrio sp. MB2005]